MRYTIVAITLASLPILLSTRTARATHEEAVDCAQQMVDAANWHGYRLRDSGSARLEQGDVMNYDVTLSRGNSYVILACGDSRAVDVDIYLYDEDGNLIDRDQGTDNRPVVTVAPRWTGPFRIRVKMYVARGAAHYTMAVLTK